MLFTLKKLIVVVGLTASGKSYSCQALCESHSGLQRIAGDEISRNALALFDIERFSIASETHWLKVNRLGNVHLAKRWLYELYLRRASEDMLLLDGYRFFFPDERLCLEAAVREVQHDAKVLYVHLKPDIDTMNCYRTAKGLSHISAKSRHRHYARFDLGFIDSVVCAHDELAALIESQGVRRRLERPDPLRARISMAPPAQFDRPAFNIDTVSRRNSLPMHLWLLRRISGSRFMSGIRRRLASRAGG